MPLWRSTSPTVATSCSRGALCSATLGRTSSITIWCAAPTSAGKFLPIAEAIPALERPLLLARAPATRGRRESGCRAIERSEHEAHQGDAHRRLPTRLDPDAPVIGVDVGISHHFLTTSAGQQ